MAVTTPRCRWADMRNLRAAAWDFSAELICRYERPTRANTTANSATLTPASSSMSDTRSFVTAPANHPAGRYSFAASPVTREAAISVACTLSLRNRSSRMKRMEKQKSTNTSVSTVCTILVLRKPALIRAIRKPRNDAASIGISGSSSDSASHSGYTTTGGWA